jgi:hypothetical protein
VEGQARLVAQADDLAMPTGQALIYYRNDVGGILFPPRFYAWASMIEDGRVVATDYAPNAGRLDRDS